MKKIDTQILFGLVLYGVFISYEKLLVVLHLIAVIFNTYYA